MLPNMKTIAITIEEDMVARVDRLSKGNRSRVIREAVREYVSKLERLVEEEQEAAVIGRHKGRLARQAVALVRGQAKR